MSGAAALRLFFGGMLLSMIALTVQASLDRSVWLALDELWPDPWFRATLADTYFSFLTVYLWMAWRERGWRMRLFLLVALLGLGSIAIAGYMLIQLRLSGGRAAALFERRAARGSEA